MTRTWPLPRTAGGPRRASTFLLRHHAGIPRRQRVELHTHRDAALHRLSVIDDQLDRLSAERVELLDELETLRDRLWPVNPAWKCRRPPALDRCPLPPAPSGATVARAGDLRTLCLVLLGRNGPLALPDLHALIHRYGHVIVGDHPVKALADAMRYEVRCGRAVRVARGVYDLDPELRARGLPRWPGGLGEPPVPWDGPVSDRTPVSPADQRERTDPGRWGGDEWPAVERAEMEAETAAGQPSPAGTGPPAPVSECNGTESGPIRSGETSEERPEGRGPAGGGEEGGAGSAGWLPP